LQRLFDYSSPGFENVACRIGSYFLTIFSKDIGAMAKGTFKKVSKSKKRMHGPRGILVCGYLPGEQSSLLCLLEQNGFKDLPVIFATDGDASQSLKELFAYEDKEGFGAKSEMRRAIIMSGFTQKELYRLMAIYRLSELPAPLWASLTPVSETWSISHLLDELAAESEAMRKRKQGVKGYSHT
jgi:hypothetical protein